jgi:hypothetical protein
MSRRLFLHIGTQKTGSSFLQHMLRKNSHLLHQNGVAYLGFTEEYISSGNGDSLLAAVKSGCDRAAFQSTVDALFGDREAAIVSSELLYSTGLSPDGPHGWHFVLGRLRECDVEVELIVFFRNPVDFLRSAYSQAVKRHGFTEDFASFIDNFSPDLYDGPLRQIESALAALAGGIRLQILDYDTARKAGLWHVFLQTCGLRSTDFLDENPTVNPSLNASQLLLHRIYNELFPQDDSGYFAELLLDNHVMASAAPLGVSEAEFHSIQERFSVALDHVNRLVRGEPVKLSPPRSFSSGPGELSMGAGELKHLLEALFSEKNRMQVLSSALPQIVEQCRNSDPELKHRHAQFDPLAYLVLNPGLIAAKVDPYRHFDEFGRHEGRKYKLGD